MKGRHLVPEWMDDPSLDEHKHRIALAGLRRINRLCGAGRYIANCIQSEFAKGQEISILDLGCGSGDVALDVAARLHQKYKIDMTGWDMSPTAINAANANLLAHYLHQKGRSHVAFEQKNVMEWIASFQGATVPKKFHIVYCTLFMHHFTDEQSIEILKAMKQLSKGVVVVDDLKRTQLGWWLAKVGCYLLSRSPVVHFDGPQSVRAAFLAQELTRIADRAGLKNAKVKHHWPERFLCCWNAT